MIQKGDYLKDLDLSIGTTVGKCPKCGKDLVIKNGKYGRFISCSGYWAWGCETSYRYKSFRLFDNETIHRLNNTENIKKELSLVRKLSDWTCYDTNGLRRIVKETEWEEVKDLAQRKLKEIREFEEWDSTH